MDKRSKIFVAGGDTLIGSGILRVLENQGYRNLLGGSEGASLRDARKLESFFRKAKPEYIFLAAGKSGGIAANQKFPAEFMLDNLLIECHVIDTACRYGVKKLLYLASSCCYPRHSPQPMREDLLLTAPLEPTNEPYAIAKIAGIKLVQSYRVQYGMNFICGIPANCFGPGDDFTLENSHVISALMGKMHTAKQKGLPEVAIWGTGTPRREFIYVDDLADACIYVMRNYHDGAPINIGPGRDVSIAEVAQSLKDITGFSGKLLYDPSKPDGMPRKLLDTTKLKAMEWETTVSFQDALKRTYAWYLETQNT